MAQHTETAEASHGAEMAHGAAEAHGATGLPQLDFSTFPNQIVWLVVALVAIYMILTRVALPRIASVLAERQGTITNDLAAAEDLKKQAEAAEAAYDKALMDARSEASRIVEAAKADMQAGLDAEIKKADAQIDAKLADSEARIAEIRDGALEAVRTVAKDTAAAVVAALGVEADQSAIDSAVDARVEGQTT